MKLLLDTHILIWSQETPKKLGKKTRTTILSADNERYVSAISAFELSRLVMGGLLSFRMPAASWLEQTIEFLVAEKIDFGFDMAHMAYELPGAFHKDPADRALVATAYLLGLTLVTADERILAYPFIHSLDARR